HGAERGGGRLDVEPGRPRRQEAQIGGVGDQAHRGVVGAGGIEHREREADGCQALENGGEPRQAVALQRLDHDLMDDLGAGAALAPARQRALRIEIERDHLLTAGRGRHRERCRQRGFAGAAFLREKRDAAHQATRLFNAELLPSSVSLLYCGAMPAVRCPLGISMSTASVETDLPRSSLIWTLSGSNGTWRPITARISSRNTASRSGSVRALRSCASRICRRSRATGAEPPRNRLKSFMLPSVQTAW